MRLGRLPTSTTPNWSLRRNTDNDPTETPVLGSGNSSARPDVAAGARDGPLVQVLMEINPLLGPSGGVAVVSGFAPGVGFAVVLCCNGSRFCYWWWMGKTQTRS